MLKDVRNIKIKGANFENLTRIPLFYEQNQPAKATLLYGRNGSGKSTIARAFREIKGLSEEIIQEAVLSDEQGNDIELTEDEKAHIFVFDEKFVNENVRLQEDGLGSIIMLGEQAGLAELIENATTELVEAETHRGQILETFKEYGNAQNPKSPDYYLNKIKEVLKKDDGWAGRKRRVDKLRQNASVTDNTYKSFINITPSKIRDDLIVDFDHQWTELEAAQNGSSKITATIPGLPSLYKLYEIEKGNQLLKQIIEHPDLSEREQYLLSLVQSGHGDELRCTAKEFESSELTICPKCHQSVSEQYKTDLISSIQKVLTDEVKDHQNRLNELLLQELTLELDSFQGLSSYKRCVELIESINSLIQHNNDLIQTKINNPYTPIDEELCEIAEKSIALEESLSQLENERILFNAAVTDTEPIKTSLKSINNEIAYWDVIEFSKKHDVAIAEREKVEQDYINAQENCKEKQSRLEQLNAQRENISIAIDVINDGLKYVFFSNDRLQIHVEDGVYRLVCKGRPVKPKDVSLGERNVIGLCYFFANILKGKSRDNAYGEEYLLVIDDPVSSYDFENRVGILSYLKLELSKILLGNINSRTLVMTHDLLTAVDIGKMYGEIMGECTKKFNGQGVCVYSPKELQDNKIIRFNNNRNEYTNLLKTVFDYANGNAAEHEPYIGNMIRQVLEAFSTFEFKKKIEDVSVDDEILGLLKCEEHRNYFKNLMYRLVLHGGSHRRDQTTNMRLDYFSFISEQEKRRTAKEILCFMYLLNEPHITAHLGKNSITVIDTWCEEIAADVKNEMIDD